jgi:small subunit ribosomal protein S8
MAMSDPIADMLTRIRNAGKAKFNSIDEEQSNTIIGLERVSKPSRRFYVKSKDIKPVLNGMGIAILSTSKGIMTDKQARSDNLGGEILCNIW